MDTILKALEARIKQGNFILVNSLANIKASNTITVLGQCYDYFNKNRNCLFHTKQMGATNN